MENRKFFKNNELLKADYLNTEKYIEDAVEVLVKNNRYEFTSNEHKLLNTIFYKCQFNYENKNKEYDIEGYKVAELTIDLFKEIFKDNRENTLKNFENIIRKFKGVELNLKTKKYTVVTYLIPKYILKDSGNTILACLDKDIYNVIMAYKEDGYSPLDIKMMYNAKGLYTQYLYEYLRSWSRYDKEEEITVTIDKLKKILKAENVKSYDRYCDFKKYAIIPAKDEINKKFNMNVDYKENKKGRSVDSITFIVKDLEPKSYKFNEIVNENLEPKEKLSDSENLLIGVGLKIASNTLGKLEKEFGEYIFNNAILILCNNHKKNKVGAPVKYLNSILNNLKDKKDSGHGNKFIEGSTIENNYGLPLDEIERKLLGWDIDEE